LLLRLVSSFYRQKVKVGQKIAELGKKLKTIFFYVFKNKFQRFFCRILSRSLYVYTYFIQIFESESHFGTKANEKFFSLSEINNFQQYFSFEKFYWMGETLVKETLELILQGMRSKMSLKKNCIDNSRRKKI